MAFQSITEYQELNEATTSVVLPKETGVLRYCHSLFCYRNNFNTILQVRAVNSAGSGPASRQAVFTSAQQCEYQRQSEHQSHSTIYFFVE